MYQRRCSSTLVFIFMLFALSKLAWSQGTTSRVVGAVHDPKGAAVAGGTVTLTNEGTKVSFTTQTTSAGTYVFDSVQVGTYTITVEAPGFKKFVSAGNVLTIGQPMTVNVTLDIGEIAEVVEVKGSQELVQTSTSGNFGNLVDEQSIKDLPIVGTRGRNPIDFVLFQPGVVNGANTGGGVHVHGARDRAWNYTLDGIDINETSAGGSNFAPLRSNPDSIEEFRVLTSNFTAEYGRNSGGQVTMVTKSGTNEFHGSAFWFYQTPGLNANPYPNTINHLGRPQFVQHIPGFDVGGPVWKNKTFFFTNLQLLRTSETRGVTSTVYTDQARRGIFRYVPNGRNRPAGVPGASVDANGNVLPGVNIGSYNIATSDPQGFGLDPQVQRILALTPLPNNFFVGDGLNTAGFSWTPTQREEQSDFTFKVDHILNAKNTLFVRWAQGAQDTFGDFVNDGWSRFPGSPRVVDTVRRPRNLAVNWRWNPTPAITNEFVTGMNRFTFNFVNADPNFVKNPPFTLNDITMPIFNFMGNLRVLTTLQLVDNFTYVRGAHTFKTGLNFRHQRHIDTRGSVAGLNVQPEVLFGIANNPVPPGTFGLPPDINIGFDRPLLQRTVNNLLGRVGSISQGYVAFGNQFAPGGTAYSFDARFPEYDFYWQDAWKLRPNLTADLGLRWEIKLSPRDPRNRLLVPNQPFVFGASPSNTLRWVPGKLYKDHWKGFGPSVGLAWDPFGTGKTSIRVNYRLAYDRMNTFVLSSTIFPNLPGQTLGIVNQDFGQGGGRIRQGIPVLSPGLTPSQLRQPIPFSTNSIHVVNPDWRPPKTNMWGLSIQQDLGRQMVLEVNYIGRRGSGLFGGYDVNQTEIFNNGFLNAFNTVAAGGDSPLMNALLANDSRLNANETGSQMVRRLFATELRLGDVAGLASTLNNTAPSTRAGPLPFFFIPFPQFSGALNVLDSNDFSTYHAFEIQLQRRFAAGFSYQVSYTFAKSLDTRSFDPTFSTVRRGRFQSASSTPFDLRNRRFNYTLSDFDRRHSLQGTWVFELPFGAGRRWASGWNPVIERIIGGWELAGILVATSGRPFTVYSGSNTLSNVVQSPAGCNGCSHSTGDVRPDPVTGDIFFFNESERRTFFTPPAGTLGNTGRNFFTGPKFFNTDLAILKRTRISERHNIEFRLEMRNLTNTPSFDLPTAFVTSSVFGRIRDDVVSIPRRMQLALKYNF